MSETTITKLTLLKGYSFKVDFDVEGVSNLLVDEVKPIGESLGPNPVRLLSASVGHCLSSSLLYCLRKARVNVKNVETTVKANIWRNEEGHLRVKDLNVEIHLETDDKDKARLHRCLDIFEDYCTVTQSVRKGIEVKVNIV